MFPGLGPEDVARIQNSIAEIDYELAMYDETITNLRPQTFPGAAEATAQLPQIQQNVANELAAQSLGRGLETPEAILDIVNEIGSLSSPEERVRHPNYRVYLNFHSMVKRQWEEAANTSANQGADMLRLYNDLSYGIQPGLYDQYPAPMMTPDEQMPQPEGGQ